jgi:hypothetical protein
MPQKLYEINPWLVFRQVTSEQALAIWADLYLFNSTMGE